MSGWQKGRRSNIKAYLPRIYWHYLLCVRLTVNATAYEVTTSGYQAQATEGPVQATTDTWYSNLTATEVGNDTSAGALPRSARCVS